MSTPIAGAFCSVCGKAAAAFEAAGLPVCEPCAGKLSGDIAEHFQARGPELSDAVHPAQGIAGVGLALIQMSLDRNAAEPGGAKLKHDLYERGCACVDAGRVWVLAEADRIVNGRRA